MNNLRKGFLGLSVKGGSAVRQVQTNAEIIESCTEIINRNPRNLEMMRIARKPVGYHLSNPGYEYWHKLFITSKARSTEAEVRHFKNGAVIKASTSEWALKKQLYRTSDTASFANLGRVLGQRCLESGISAVYCNLDTTNSEKYKSLVNAMKEVGLQLEEPPMYKHANPWDMHRMPKPWEVEG